MGQADRLRRGCAAANRGEARTGSPWATASGRRRPHRRRRRRGAAGRGLVRRPDARDRPARGLPVLRTRCSGRCSPIEPVADVEAACDRRRVASVRADRRALLAEPATVAAVEPPARRSGNLYVNRQITGAMVGRQPFGGNKLSGVGFKAGGPGLPTAVRRVPGGEREHDAPGDRRRLTRSLPSPAQLGWPLDRARWGVSGALYPQSALAGLSAHPRVVAFGASTPQVALKVRSRAMRAREPGQIRKEAALSDSEHVPRFSLTRANHGGHARRPLSKVGCTVLP